MKQPVINSQAALKPPLVDMPARNASSVRNVSYELIRRAMISPDLLTVGAVGELQRAIGNQALVRLLKQSSTNLEFQTRYSGLRPQTGMVGRKGSGFLRPDAAVQRQVGKAVPTADSSGDAISLLSRMNLFGILSPAEWQIVAENAATLVRTRPSASDIIDRYLRFLAISWETVTSEQRVVFMALDDARKEKLRKDALKLSPLYNAITEVHLPAGFSAASTGTMRGDVNKMRESPAHTRAQFAYVGSAAYEIATGAIAIPALVDPVKNALVGKTKRRDRQAALALFPNLGLAAWVAASSVAKVKKLLKGLACGIGNLFAFALSRGDVAIAASGPPSIADAAIWLKKWTLDAAADRRLITEKVAYNPRVVLRELSGSKKVAVQGGLKYTRPVGSDSQASRSFVKFVENRLRSAKLTPKDEARLALVQGGSHTHSFIVYKDLDGVWRPMDVYLNLEDTASEEFGSPGRYSKEVSTVYFGIDAKK